MEAAMQIFTKLCVEHLGKAYIINRHVYCPFDPMSKMTAIVAIFEIKFQLLPNLFINFMEMCMHHGNYYNKIGKRVSKLNQDGLNLLPPPIDDLT